MKLHHARSLVSALLVGMTLATLPGCQTQPSVALTLDLTALAAVPAAQRADVKLHIRVSGDERACLIYPLCDTSGDCAGVAADNKTRTVYYPLIAAGKLRFTATLVNKLGQAVAFGSLDDNDVTLAANVTFASLPIAAPAASDDRCTPSDCGLDVNPCTINTARQDGPNGSRLCRYQPAPQGTVCNPSRGACDPTETCDGQSRQCPADVIMPNGTTCRPAAGDCDAAEACDGRSAVCPPDRFTITTDIPCHESHGLCDPPEYCNGQQADCPRDQVSPEGTACGVAPEQPCQTTASCDGVSVDCPGPIFQPGCDNLVRDGGFDAFYPLPLPMPILASAAWTLAGDSLVTTGGVCSYFGTSGPLRPPGNLLCGGQLGCQGGRGATTSQLINIPPGTDPELYFDGAFATPEVQGTTAVLTVSVLDINGIGLAVRIIPGDPNTTQCTTSPCLFKYKLGTRLGTFAGKQVLLQFAATSNDPPLGMPTSFCIDNVVMRY